VHTRSNSCRAAVQNPIPHSVVARASWPPSMLAQFVAFTYFLTSERQEESVGFAAFYLCNSHGGGEFADNVHMLASHIGSSPPKSLSPQTYQPCCAVFEVVRSASRPVSTPAEQNHLSTQLKYANTGIAISPLVQVLVTIE